MKIVMFRSKRLIGDIFAFVGVILVIAGLVLPPAQYLAWRWTDVWRPFTVRAACDAMGISLSQAIGAMLELPLWIAMLTVGVVLIWISAEFYEQDARLFRAKNAADRRPSASSK
jgi:ABC-type Mn2+/Zn2+ transport system permease subunit